jgi:class 3 adenylate cyclase
MSLYLDVHDGLGDATAEDVAAAHKRDLEVQGKYGARFLTYWLNSPDGKVFCLVDAPDKDAAVACHKEAHGLLPHNMIDVEPNVLSQFLGDWEQNVPSQAMMEGARTEPDTGLRAIMFTDIEGSTNVSTIQGDDAAVEMVRAHDDLARECLAEAGGREVKHTGDGIFAAFPLVTAAVECSMAIQQRLRRHREATPDGGFRVRIGVSAGEPVTNSDDLFGAAVNLAARICTHAKAGQIIVSRAVRDLSVGKRFEYLDLGRVPLKGFPDPEPLFAVAWA